MTGIEMAVSAFPAQAHAFVDGLTLTAVETEVIEPFIYAVEIDPSERAVGKEPGRRLGAFRIDANLKPPFGDAVILFHVERSLLSKTGTGSVILARLDEGGKWKSLPTEFRGATPEWLSFGAKTKWMGDFGIFETR